MLNSEPVDVERTLCVGHQWQDTRPFTLRWWVMFPALAWVTADHKPLLLDGHQVPCMRGCGGLLSLLLQKPSLLLIPASRVQGCLKDIKSLFRSLPLCVFSNLCCVRSVKPGTCLSYSLNCVHLRIPSQIICFYFWNITQYPTTCLESENSSLV